ncbi:MAG: dihydroorotate dehydrogenase [Actinomycetota bacterium]|nr:dihydroorotate dehydrogenase [Actinomycetota bacterium]
MRRTLADRSAQATPATPALLATRVGRVELRSAVLTASGTSGHGAELAGYGELQALGAVVVKSLAAHPWPGNEGMRLHGAAGGSMLNRVGLQGPGVAAWRTEKLPALLARHATVVASIWGRSAEEFAAAAAALAGAPGVVALEVNVSCPNLSGHVFAHSPGSTAAAVAAAVGALGGSAAGAGGSAIPVWAKLSPAVADIVEIADAALGAGAAGLTLVNTMPGMWVDVEGRRAPMAGGLSGAALHPVAVRAVYDCRRAFRGAAIVGVGGVSSGVDAVELLMAGADAVQVGTATFADPRAPWRVQEELARWCARRATSVEEIVGAAQR